MTYSAAAYGSLFIQQKLIENLLQDFIIRSHRQAKSLPFDSINW